MTRQHYIDNIRFTSIVAALGYPKTFTTGKGKVMKKVICVCAILFAFGVTAFAQELPSWAKMGMTLTQVRQQASNDKLVEQSDKMGDTGYVFFGQKGIFIFSIDAERGLFTVRFMPRSGNTVKTVVEYLQQQYGPANIPDKYVWYNNDALPEGVVYLGIDQLDNGTFTVRYVFENGVPRF
jgi:hypothetical protein